MRLVGLIAVIAITFATPAASQSIIDAHRHGAWPHGNDADVIANTLTVMESHDVATVVVSVTDYDDPAKWRAALAERVVIGVKLACPRNLAAPRYNCFPSDEGWANIDWLRAQIKDGLVDALHELGPNYYGISAANPRLAPYFALAEEFDLPIGIHTQRGPPPEGKNTSRVSPHCCPDYDPEMGNPALLRPVLKKHPNLRIWLQHVGAGRAGGYEPFWDETLALLRDYPNVYVDLSITNGPRPIAQYESSLKRLIDAGFGDRIMLGSDMLPLGMILNRLNSFDWISDVQKRAIVHDNAARFFRLGTDVPSNEQLTD